MREISYTDTTPNGCYPEVVQDNVNAPFAVYNLTSCDPSPTKDRLSALDTWHITVSFYSKTQRESQEMADDFRAEIEDFSDTTFTIDTVPHVIQSIQLLNYNTDFYDNLNMYVSDVDIKVRIIN